MNTWKTKTNILLHYIYIYIYIYMCVCVCVCHFGGHALAQLVEALRYSKFAVSIPDGVTGIFN